MKIWQRMGVKMGNMKNTRKSLDDLKSDLVPMKNGAQKWMDELFPPTHFFYPR
jgi:hypothetical protein